MLVKKQTFDVCFFFVFFLILADISKSNTKPATNLMLYMKLLQKQILKKYQSMLNELQEKQKDIISPYKSDLQKQQAKQIYCQYKNQVNEYLQKHITFIGDFVHVYEQKQNKKPMSRKKWFK